MMIYIVPFILYIFWFETVEDFTLR